jgi:uncharacterized protein (TIGR00266 family)
MADSWYYAQGQQRVGPMPASELIRQLPGVGGAEALVYGPGMKNWARAGDVPELAQALGFSPAGFDAAPPPPPAGLGYGGYGNPPVSAGGGRQRAHEIDLEIFGNEMQYVVVTLDGGETVIAEPGGMMFMTPGIEMKTVFGDPNKDKSGFFDKLKTAGKRLLTGENMFMSTFTNTRGGREQVAFAAPYPGKILPLELTKWGGEIICQKDSFLCAAKGTEIGIAFQKKIGVGLFGGEGFIMQRLVGDGQAVVHAGGTLMERDLAPGEQLKIDTGCIVAFTPGVQYDIQFVGGFKNTLFGGEGLFFANLTGPGHIWLQSLPFSRLAGRVLANATGGKDEGSMLGGLGRMLGGNE